MTDLFTYAERYPLVPGFKARETAQEAAQSLKPKAKRLQGLCLDALSRHGPLTADECADRLNIDKLSIRPRFSELAAMWKIVDTGTRRENSSGKRAIVWSLPPIARAA
jgi:predicted ArsR family transcriptional regulator